MSMIDVSRARSRLCAYAPHGLLPTHGEDLDRDLVDFIRAR